MYFWCVLLTHDYHHETFEMLREMKPQIRYFEREKQYGKTNGAASLQRAKMANKASCTLLPTHWGQILCLRFYTRFIFVGFSQMANFFPSLKIKQFKKQIVFSGSGIENDFSILRFLTDFLIGKPKILESFEILELNFFFKASQRCSYFVPVC